MKDASQQLHITGRAVATSLGLTLGETFDRAARGECGIRSGDALEQSPSPDVGIGQAPALPAEFMPDAHREVRYLRHVLNDALADSRIDLSQLPPHRIGIVLGTTLHGMRSAGDYLRTGDFQHLRHFQAAAVLRNAIEGLPIHGPAHTVCTACASGLSAISMAMLLLQRGEIDLAIAGGYDPISEYAYAGFNSLKLISTGPQRPFASDRTGMKLAEGYGIITIERQADALARGAATHLRLLSCTGSADAHHLSQPLPTGEGAARAMRAAIRSAHLRSSDIDLIAAHATATPDNDGAEYAAFSQVFGVDFRRVPVTAFKSHLGHGLGAAGAVELILMSESLRRQVVPRVANVRRQDVAFSGFRLVTDWSESVVMRRGMVVSLGFGGSNACCVLEHAPEPIEAPAVVTEQRKHPRVVITGIGSVFPGLADVAALAARWSQPIDRHLGLSGPVGAEELQASLQARRTRRMSEYVKLALAASTEALRQAGFDLDSELGESSGAVLGTTHGSADFSRAYYGQIVADGLNAANPLLFAEGVPNAGAAHVSMAFGIRGACQSVIGSRTAGLDAVRMAAARIASGEVQRVLVNAAEEHAQPITQAYASCGLHGSSFHPPLKESAGFIACAGSVSLLLESETSAVRRGATILATIEEVAQRRWPTEDLAAAVQAAADAMTDAGSAAAMALSGNSTWIDRIEAMALRKAWGKQTTGCYPYGVVGECASALPLAALAAMLATGRMPGADGAPVRDFAICASDYNGWTTVLRCTRA